MKSATVAKRIETMFTKGSWGRNIAPASKYPVIFAGRNTHVAMVISKGLPVNEVEANASLIAAAPDMYAMLAEIASGIFVSSDKILDQLAKACGD